MKPYKTDTEAKAKILEKFSFGFEVEGLFSSDLQKINLIGSGDYNHAGFKSDGSVHMDNEELPFSDLAQIGGGQCDNCDGSGYFRQDCECDYDCDFYEHDHSENCDAEACEEEEEEDEGHNHSEVCCSIDEHAHDEECLPCYDDDDAHEVSCDYCDDGERNGSGRASEFASPVYEDLNTALEQLSLFNSNTYAFNETCGLHFHIGAKNEKWQKQLWQLVGNYDLLERLHTEALTYCRCQKKRTLSQLDPNLGRSRFCEKTKSPLSLIFDFKGSTKYRFVRFHKEYKTLEFRFLSPCQHKIENVKKLIDTLLDFATSSEAIKEIGQAETRDTKKETLELTFSPRKAEEVEHERIEQLEQKELLKQDIEKDFKLYFMRNYGDSIPMRALADGNKADLYVEILMGVHNSPNWGRYMGHRADNGRAYLENLDLFDDLTIERYTNQLRRMRSEQLQPTSRYSNRDEVLTIAGLNGFTNAIVTDDIITNELNDIITNELVLSARNRAYISLTNL